MFDERRLQTYLSLGLTEEDDGLLTLTTLGRELACRLEPEIEGFRELLNRVPPYLTAVRWMHERNLEVVTSTDLLAFWSAVYDLDEKHNPETMRGAVTSYFSLCEAAELGTLTLGKRGHTTRLRVDHEELTRFYEARLVAEI